MLYSFLPILNWKPDFIKALWKPSQLIAVLKTSSTSEWTIKKKQESWAMQSSSAQSVFYPKWNKINYNRYQIHLCAFPTLFPEVRCPPISTLKNILLSPPACGKRAFSPGAACLLNCRKGYTLQGNRKAVCLGSGNWTANVHKATCAGVCVCFFSLLQRWSQNWL